MPVDATLGDSTLGDIGTSTLSTIGTIGIGGIGDNCFGVISFGDVGVSVATNPVQTTALISGIFPINQGGMLIDYTVTEESNAIYDIIGVMMVGMIGRKLR